MTREQWVQLLERASNEDGDALAELDRAQELVLEALRGDRHKGLEELDTMLGALEAFDPTLIASFRESFRNIAGVALSKAYALAHQAPDPAIRDGARAQLRKLGLDPDKMDNPEGLSNTEALMMLDTAHKGTPKS